ncbi:hypothetical protein LINPERPRIM_LOCUS6417, partial [Linum perenne]
FFLLEFHSVKLCEWVLERSWHIHNSGLILRRWEKGVKPIDFSQASKPEWVEFQGVPPELITVDGVSWISSKVGKPMNKFVRDGTNVRVCVLRDRANPFPDEVKVNNEGERVVIPVVQHKPRVYRRPGAVWQEKAKVVAVDTDGKGKDPVVQKTTENVDDGGGKDPDSCLKEGGLPGTPKGLQILLEEVQVSHVVVPSEKLSSSEGAGTSNSKKKKRKKKKTKSGGGGESQSSSLPVMTTHSGNEVASSKGGTASPVSDGHGQVTGGGISNASKASLEVEEAPIQHANRMGPVEDPPYGNLTDCTEEEVLIAEHSGRKATLGDFFPTGKPLVSKQKYVVSGVKTRFKNKNI